MNNTDIKKLLCSLWGVNLGLCMFLVLSVYWDVSEFVQGVLFGAVGIIMPISILFTQHGDICNND